MLVIVGTGNTQVVLGQGSMKFKSIVKLSIPVTNYVYITTVCWPAKIVFELEKRNLNKRG